MTQRVYLIGFMGSGKSTLGRWLANAMDGWTFIDMDQFIESKYHKTIPQIFADKGEEGFRKMEALSLKELSTFENVIIGTGGGTPCFFDNMERMNSTGLSIYLKLSPQIIYDRLQTSKTPRPLILDKHGDELLNFIADKLKERESFYMQASIIADANEWEVQDFVEAIRKFKVES